MTIALSVLSLGHERRSHRGLSPSIVAPDLSDLRCLAAAPGSLRSAGYNLTNDKNGAGRSFGAATGLVNKKPLLGHLANNGGPTQTLLPGAKSPAADVIPSPSPVPRSPESFPVRGVATGHAQQLWRWRHRTSRPIAHEEVRFPFPAPMSTGDDEQYPQPR